MLSVSYIDSTYTVGISLITLCRLTIELMNIIRDIPEKDLVFVIEVLKRFKE